MEVNVSIEDESILAALSEEWFYTQAEQILQLCSAGPSEMGISLVDLSRMREINRKHRHIDSATDVIAFQMECADGFVVPNDMRHLGDVVICVPVAINQAQEYECSVEQEVRRLLIHGILHLLGFDHEQERDEKHMNLEEERIALALEKHYG